MTLAEDRAAGFFGGEVIEGGDTVNGRFFAIQILEAAVFDTEDTVSNVRAFEKLDGVELAAGVWLYGVFTTVKLVSGIAICHDADA